MKTTKLKTGAASKTVLFFFITLALISFIQSCKKNDGIIVPSDFNQLNGSCIVTQTSDAAGLGVFGELNFVATFIWEKRTNRENGKVVSDRHDYVLCFCKSNEFISDVIRQLPMTAERVWESLQS